MGTRYEIAQGKWREGLVDEKVCGAAVRVAAPGDFLPESGQRLGEAGCHGRRSRPKDADCVQVGGRYLAVSPPRKRAGFFRRRVGWARVVESPESGSLQSGKAAWGYVALTRVRKSAVAGCLLALLAAAALAFWALTGIAPQYAPAYLADQAGITGSGAAARADISYATYESTPDVTWKAGRTKQKIVLRLPGETTQTDSAGNSTTVANPVLSAPSVWVDIDHDGEFAAGECVFNPPTYDENGNVTYPGKMLEPGRQVSEIELVRDVPKGTYDAQTRWTSVTADESHAPANPMTFAWKLEVR